MNKNLCIQVGVAVTLFFIVNFVVCDVSHLGAQQQQQPNLLVTDTCLGCICEAASNCNATLRCDGEVCGLFRITWPYWADAGKPTQPGEDVSSPTAYANCVNEPLCAARAIQNYMVKFGQDCNGDNIVDCYDYAAIHKMGGYGCKTSSLPYDYKTKFDNCIAYALAYSQG